MLRRTLTQLYLLLWRNALIRWRVGSVTVFKTFRLPVLQVVEVIWPLVICLALAIIRHKFPSQHIKDSAYRPYAMPSAGAVPFLQTVFCDAGRGSHKEPYSDMPTYPNAKINEIYPMLDEIGTWNVTWTKLCDDLHALAAAASCLDYTNTPVAQHCGQIPDGVPVTCYLRNVTDFKHFLLTDLQLSPGLVDQVLGATIRTSQAGAGDSDSEGTGGGGVLPSLLTVLGLSSGTSLKALVCSTRLLDGVIHFSNITMEDVQDEMCNLSDSQWTALSQELQKQSVPECSPEQVATSVLQVVSVQQFLQRSDLVKLFQSFSSLDVGGGGECGQGTCDSEWNAGTYGNKHISAAMKKFVHFFCGSSRSQFSPLLSIMLVRSHFGDTYKRAELQYNKTSHNRISTMKIPYTPATNLTLSIIRRANRTFETVAQLLALANQVENCSVFFLDNFPPESLTGTTEILDQVIAFREGELPVSSLGTQYLANLYPNISLQQLVQTRDFLNASSPTNIWSVMKKVHMVASNMIAALARFNWDVFLPVANETAMEHLFADYDQQAALNITYLAAGLVFDPDLPHEPGHTFKNTTIKIRARYSSILTTSTIRDIVWHPGPYPEDSLWHKRRYMYGLFIFMQDMVERAMLEEMVGTRVASPGVYTQQMPYPCYKNGTFFTPMVMIFILPLALLFSWLFPVAMTARAVVHEKETRLKEYMKMMGVGEGLLRLSWFLHSFLVLLVSVVGITMLLKLGRILPATDAVLLFLYLTLYALAMLSYSFLVSVFFTNANLAACVAGLTYFMVLFAHVPLVAYMESLSPAVIGICCLWSPLAFAIGATYLAQWELKQEGLQWSNIALPPIQDDHLSFLAVCILLALDVVLYLLLAWYLEGVFPGRYGVAKPWYFPFQPSYWCGLRKRPQQQRFRKCARLGNPVEENDQILLQEEEEMSDLMSEAQAAELGENCEEEPEGLVLGVSIKSLTKKFVTGLLPWKREKIQAVDNLTLNFFEGQITAFLGHNGAGKTTTLSMLTGLFEPSSGSASIYGNSILENMDTIRESLGVCPQHNILFHELTVEEHLMFYGQLKGLSRAEAKRQVPIWLEKVDLSGHAQKLSKHLSGGMKRKLSILLAFVGKSRTIILDEPTSGVDPFARRQIWDFLLKNTEKRTIILSTHHMDEAELLGDRIAIISRGSLLCCGSFEYLMHRFGHGHRLTMVTKSQSEYRPSVSSRTFTITAEVEQVDQGSLPQSPTLEDPSLSDSMQQQIIVFLQSFITGASLVEKRGKELHFLLPLLQARPRHLAHLFAELEQQKERLGVVSYGMTACSMEEIFMQLTEKELMEKTETNELEEYVPCPTLHSDLQTSLSPPVSVQSSPPAEVGEEDSNSGVQHNAHDQDGVFDKKRLLFGDESCNDLLGSGHSHDDHSRMRVLRLWLLQFYASLVKRVHYTKGALLALVVQNVLPLLLILVSLFIARALIVVHDPPALELSPHLFFAKAKYNYLFVGGTYSNITAPMVDSLFQPCGVSAHTVGSALDPSSPCYLDTSRTPQQQMCPARDYPQVQYSCNCASCKNDSLQEQNNCSVLMSSITSSACSSVPACYNGTGTGSRVMNVTQSQGVGTAEWLHNYLLRSTNSFIEQRYGGNSFGHVREDVDESVDELNADPSVTMPFLASRAAAKVWYSLKGYHAMPAYLNTLNNAILRGSLKNVSTDQLSEYGIRTYSHPFKLHEVEKLYYSVTENTSFLVCPMATIFGLGFVVAGFVLILIEERASGIKHLQMVCGMSKLVYWLCAYVWDLMWYCLFCLVMVILFVAMKDKNYTGEDELPLFLLILFCYGLAAIPWVYMLSFMFTSPSTAYVVIFCLNFFSGFTFNIVDAIVMELEQRLDSGLIHYTLLWVPFPAYALGRCMMFLSMDKPLHIYLATFTLQPIDSDYSQLAPFFASLLVQSVLYSMVVIFIELSPLITNKIIRCKDLSLPVPNNEDAAVSRERCRVLQKHQAKGDLLVLRNLTKIYGTHCSSQYRLAVNQLCLRMQKAECFGLLGVNGAGKTSTFRMLTGDIRMTSGEASIGSTSVSASQFKVAQNGMVGYCPQVDALMDSLTGRQHLTFYCRLRGLAKAETKKVVELMLVKLMLKDYADKPAGTYSGGNRRKLSTAIALLARPSLILLDEPTSGVDPLARRFLWSVVRNVVSAGQSVVLTTHSMAECEALCSRVGIMVNGSFCCLGSIQQLKSAYGDGYRLKIRVTGQIEEVKEFVRQNIDNAVLKEEHCTSLVYQLTGEELKLSSVYTAMEAARESMEIKDYSLSQTTLDDVFIHFANQQNENAGLTLLPSGRNSAMTRHPRSPTQPLPASSNNPGPLNIQLPDIVTNIHETPPI